MRRAQRRKYHYFYKTTCVITNRYYYGMHSTDNLDDGYIGSGKRLWYSIKKHGKENHICEKLEFFESREKLKEKEIEIVNDDLLKDPLCMNLKYGGEGGFCSLDACRKGGRNVWKNENNLNRLRKQASLQMKNLHLNKKINYATYGFKNKKHKEETKEKMRSHIGKQKGEKNSQYGTCLIYNFSLKQNKRIKKEELQSWISKGWIRGAKYKW